VDMLHAAYEALFVHILNWQTLLLLSLGVVMGLFLGILPGIGGIAGTAMLIPFTYSLEPAAAMALLLGLAATNNTSDQISAIVLGAPGSASSAATTLDGFPMTKRGEAGRALGASYMASLMGGLFGAAVMALALPLVRPIILYIGSPELFAMAVFGLSMVAVLSGNTPLRGLTCACFGILLAMIGSDPQTGTLRWTMGQLYLWEGLPLVPLTLGIFALPELCDLMIGRTSITQVTKKLNLSTGLTQGIRDCFDNWFLVVRCSALGTTLGAVPGIGASVIDWLSYGHALKTEKGAQQTFGKGDVRGVIAAESATNSREGGALIPTVVFGVPASAGMAILLGAFLIHGLVPGPDMVTTNLSITYSMVWSIAIANILAAGTCFLLSGQFAKLATLRYSLFLPAVLCLIYIGAFQSKREWGDLYALLFFGVLGWALKHFKWPRPPLVLGFILGGILERYMFISIQRYGADWLLIPFVRFMFALSALSLLGSLLQDVRMHGGARGLLSNFGPPQFSWSNMLPVFLLVLFGVMMLEAVTWNQLARIVPIDVGSAAILFCSLALLTQVFKNSKRAPATASLSAAASPRLPSETSELRSGSYFWWLGMGALFLLAWLAVGDLRWAIALFIIGRIMLKSEPTKAAEQVQQKVHMDVVSTISDLPVKRLLIGGAIFFGWLVVFLLSMATIGLIPTIPLFVIAFMRIEAREPWYLCLPYAIFMTIFVYVVFDWFLALPWPPTLLGDYFPELRGQIPSV
jgi:TctA family transporter